MVGANSQQSRPTKIVIIPTVIIPKKHHHEPLLKKRGRARMAEKVKKRTEAAAAHIEELAREAMKDAGMECCTMEELYQNAVKDDKTMAKYLQCWARVCERHKRPDLHISAMIALSHWEDLAQLWGWHHAPDEKTQATFDLSAPGRKGKNTLDYTAPGKEFSLMGTEMLHMCWTWLNDCVYSGVHITRLDWEYHLMKGIQMLGGMTGKGDPEKRILAMLVCLILSAASTDFSCIGATIRLHEKGLLDIEKLIAASDEEIQSCIAEGGIGVKRTQYLRNAFTMIRDKFNGKVPRTVEELVLLPGVGRKTAVLLLNEGVGLFVGIGTDKHVCTVSHGLG